MSHSRGTFTRLLPDPNEFSLNVAALSSWDGIEDIALLVQETALNIGEDCSHVEWSPSLLGHGSNALDNFMKLNGYPHRTVYGRKCFWTIRLSHLIEPKLNLA